MTRLPRTRGVRLAAASGLLVAGACVGAGGASAAAISVTATADVRSADGLCSLREAIDSANADSAPFAGAGECVSGSGADVVSLPAGTFELSLASSPSALEENANAEGDLDVLGTELTLSGVGADATRIEGKGIDRVIDVRPNRIVTIRGLTITGGHARTGTNGGDATTIGTASAFAAKGVPGGEGGGIRNDGGNLTVEDSVVTANTAGTGGTGGLAKGGDGATASRGVGGASAAGGDGGAGGAGGGIYTTGALTLRRVTITGNIGGAGGTGGTGTGGQGGGGTSLGGGSGGLADGGSGGAGGRGGGVAGDENSIVVVDSSTIAANVAGMGGGGALGQGGGGGVGQGNGGDGGGGVGGSGGAGGTGGGLSAFGSLSVVGSTLEANTAGAANDGGNGTGGQGGGAVGSGGLGGTGGNGVGGFGGHGGDGGGLELDPHTVTASLTNVTVVANAAGVGGAAATGKGGKGGGSASGSGGHGGDGHGVGGGNAGSGGGLITRHGTTAQHVTLSTNMLSTPGAGGTGIAGAGGSPGGSAGASAGGPTGFTGTAGAIEGDSATTLTNSIAAGNAIPSCEGGIKDGGHDFVFPDGNCPGPVVDPELAPLADNGGPTRTLALGSTSPALDAVPSTGAGCPQGDQRGVARPFGSGCDSGAYERAAPGTVTGDAAGVTIGAATLQGNLAPNATSAEWHFEIGTTTAYGMSTDAQSAAGVDPRDVSAAIGGLAPSTTFHYRLVATNADGTGAGDDRTLTTPDVPVGPPPPSDLAPSFLAASLSPTVFAVDRRGPAEVGVAAARKGTTIRYALSEAARVTVTIQRRTSGRKVAGKCRKRTRANRRKPTCTRWVRRGRFAVVSVAGLNRHRFSGRIGRSALRPGTYRAVLLAIDAAGQASRPKGLKFKVVRR